MISNNARVARALYLLKLDLDNFVAREFTNYHQDQTLTVLNQIPGPVPGLPKAVPEYEDPGFTGRSPGFLVECVSTGLWAALSPAWFAR